MFFWCAGRLNTEARVAVLDDLVANGMLSMPWDAFRDMFSVEMDKITETLGPS